MRGETRTGDLDYDAHLSGPASHRSTPIISRRCRPLSPEIASRKTFYEDYHPYGTSAYRAWKTGTEVSAKRYRYTGKERDDETSLYYHGARYYAPWLGRWTAADPMGTVDGTNLYAYVRGSPVNLIDPSGTKGNTFQEKGFFEASKELAGQEAAARAKPADVMTGQTFDLHASVRQAPGPLAPQTRRQVVETGPDPIPPVVEENFELPIFRAGWRQAIEMASDPKRSKLERGTAAGVGLLFSGLAAAESVVFGLVEVPANLAISSGKHGARMAVLDDAGRTADANAEAWTAGLKFTGGAALALAPMVGGGAARATKGVAAGGTLLGGEGMTMGATRLGGELFPASRLPVLERHLARRGVTLQVGDELLPFGKAAGFDAKAGRMVFMNNPTRYEVQHELLHWIQSRKLGVEAYSKLTPLDKEQFVFNMFSDNPSRWMSLSPEQQTHAVKLVEGYGGVGR